MLGVLAALCAHAEAPPGPVQGGNLVLVTLDTTRADHLGAWGWPHARTPHLDRLAARGTRFSRCDTAVPVTLPSHATILTGLYPPRHGVRDNATFALGEEIETVAERLRTAGYDTAAVVSAVVLARRYGTAQGFRIYDDDLGTGAEGKMARERLAGDTTDQALALVADLGRPFFLWVHYFDPHDPYSPPSPWAEESGGPHRGYDGEIAYMDEHVGRLLGGLADARVLVVGDHGEMLGDHGEPTHGLLLNHGARRVPLILAGPGIAAGRTVGCLVRTADVAPTLLELAGLEIPGGLDGRSLVPLLGEETCGRESYAESFLPLFAHQWYPLRALADERWLYVHGPRPGLFDLEADPGEENDLGASRAPVVERRRARLEVLVEEMGDELEGSINQGRTLSADEAAQLRSLGYVGGGGEAAVRADLPDPRDMVEVARSIHRAGRLVEDGRCDEALPLLLEVTKRDDRSFPAYNMAGLCLQSLGRLESALNAFRRASSLSPRAVEPLANSGACLIKLGRFGEAAEVYRRAMELDPTAPGVASNLAAILRQRGDAGAAAEVLDSAIAAGGRYAALYVERGVLAGGRGDLRAAFTDFEEASRLDPANPDALGNAARAALMLKRPREAAARFEKLTELVPGDAGLWTMLGRLYLEELGERAEAERCWRRALALESDPARRSQIESLLAGG